MSSVAALKALVTVSALGMGAGAVALVVAVQRDPFAFTTAQPEPAAAAIVEVRPVAPPIDVTPAVPAALIEAEPPAPVEAAPVATRHQHRATRSHRPAKVRARSAPEPVIEETPVDRVIPAPCVEGEYRKLEEHRGVRLMCPGAL